MGLIQNLPRFAGPSRASPHCLAISSILLTVRQLRPPTLIPRKRAMYVFMLLLKSCRTGLVFGAKFFDAVDARLRPICLEVIVLGD